MSEQQLPEASFVNFLSGLGAQAWMQLGRLPHPHSGERLVNLPFARYSVQLLEVLRDKSAGNRTDDEERYLSGLLADLRQALEQEETKG